MGVMSAAVSLVVLAVSQMGLGRGAGMVTAAAVVALVIAVGLVFDLVGVSCTAAAAEPFHARAAHRYPGAVQSLRLVRHADRVANFCLDFVGDVSGTLAGALGTAAVYSLAHGHSVLLWGSLAVAVIAGLNVGMKALAKAVAVADAEAVVTLAGEVLWALERLGMPPLLANGRKGGTAGRA
jgi:hypothetical protein